MASKQLGKLRQWAGEVMSSRDKTNVPEEIADLEHEIELRKDGIQKLCTASDEYHRLISKKKQTDAHGEDEKLLPIDTLGIVMISHGEEFGDDSTFGTSLVKLGRAHCRVATLQEAYALTFHDTFIDTLKKFLDDIKDYEHQRRKLESRRLSYDAAVSKWEKLKSTKKDKERIEAEDDMDRAKQRYEETTEDLHAYMKIIQDNEAEQQRELSAFLDLELNFVSQYFEVLKDVKSDWTNVSASSPIHSRPMSSPQAAKARRPSNPAHKITHSFSSRRSHSRANSHALSDSSEDEGSFATAPPSRRASHSRSESGVKAEPSSGRRSRAASAASHKRAASNASRPASPDDTTSGSKPKKSGGVAGWASSAVESVRGKRKQENKDKDNFAALQDDVASRDSGEHDEPTRGSPIIKASMPSIMRRRSKPKVADTSSPKIGVKTLKSSSVAGRRTVRALYDFNGAPDADELAFRAGDQILVLSEVLDGWWMGELNGRKGLFPTSYTEGSLSKPTPKSTASELPNDDDMYGTASDVDDYTSSKPLTPAETHSSPFFGAIIPPDTASEDETDRHLSSSANPRFSVASDSTSASDMRPMMRRTTTDTSTISSTSSISVGVSSGSMSRKAPPPPPPRRPTLSMGATSAPPPLPSRRPPSSTGSTANLSLTRSSSVSTHNTMDYDASPFESAADLSAGCGVFKQAQFQQRGMCSNCMQVHAIV